MTEKKAVSKSLFSADWFLRGALTRAERHVKVDTDDEGCGQAEEGHEEARAALAEGEAAGEAGGEEARQLTPRGAEGAPVFQPGVAGFAGDASSTAAGSAFHPHRTMLGPSLRRTLMQWPI